LLAPAFYKRSLNILGLSAAASLSAAALMLGTLVLAPASASASAAGNDSSSRQSTAPAKDDKKANSKKGGADADSTRPTASGSPDNVPAAYRIGVDDQIQISVWREHDLSLSVVVRPDGVITMPLLNDINVVGMTPKELAESLTEKLKPFVNEPQVTVSVQAIHSRKVYLIGNASRPGVFDLNDNKTAMELIAEAGGLSQFAKTNSIYILRTVNGSESRIPFHYKDAVNGKSPDVLLMPGDKIVVP
jgi:polysaccharide export outer membrane protein